MYFIIDIILMYPQFLRGAIFENPKSDFKTLIDEIDRLRWCMFHMLILFWRRGGLITGYPGKNPLD